MRKNKPEAEQPDLPAGEAAPETPPAKLSKLQAAMHKVNTSLTAVEQLAADIDELERVGGPKVVFAVATKEGRKQADEVRKKARLHRLDVKRMKKEATDLLNGLKTETWALMDPTIERLDAIESNAKAQIEAEDAKEEKRKQGHRDAIAAIQLMAEGAASMSSADLDQRLNEVAAIIVDDSYQEFHAEAVRAKAATQDILMQAHAEAVKREREAAEKAEAEARQTVARCRIAALKALPAELADTGNDNIRAIREGLARETYPETEFGDLAEFVGMARDAAVRALDDLLALPLPDPEPENSIEAPEAGLLQNLPHDEPTEEELGAAADALADEPVWVGVDFGREEQPEPDTFTGNLFGAEAPPDVPPAIPQAAQRAAAELEADPFSGPVVLDHAGNRPTSTAQLQTIARPTGRMPIPARRPVPEPAKPEPGSYFTPPAGIVVTEVPCLLKAAQDFITTAEECCGWTVDADPLNVPTPLIAVWRTLHQATALLSEFPPSN